MYTVDIPLSVVFITDQKYCFRPRAIVCTERENATLALYYHNHYFQIRKIYATGTHTLKVTIKLKNQLMLKTVSIGNKLDRSFERNNCQTLRSREATLSRDKRMQGWWNFPWVVRRQWAVVTLTVTCPQRLEGWHEFQKLLELEHLYVIRECELTQRIWIQVSKTIYNSHLFGCNTGCGCKAATT